MTVRASIRGSIRSSIRGSIAKSISFSGAGIGELFDTVELAENTELYTAGLWSETGILQASGNGKL